jgi:hypothetical protein
MLKKYVIHVYGALLLFHVSCSEKIDNTGTCQDGIKNQGEYGVDCGGPCDEVCPNCADGIQNQGETGVDCGGPCSPCYPELKALVGADPWNSTSRNASLIGQNSIRIFGTDQLASVTLNYSGPFQSGIFPAGTLFDAEYRDGNGNIYNAFVTGTIEFIAFDTTARTVSGAFKFEATDPVTSNKVQVNSGVFNVLSY